MAVNRRAAIAATAGISLGCLTIVGSGVAAFGEDPTFIGTSSIPIVGGLRCPGEQFASFGIFEVNPDGYPAGGGPQTPTEALDLAIGGQGPRVADFDIRASTPDYVQFTHYVDGDLRFVADVERVPGGWAVVELAACNSVIGN